MLIHFSYSSILLTDTSENTLLFRDPVCDPKQLIRMEEQYMKIASRDHTLWGSEREGSTVICESMMISDEKRLDTPVYRECYSRWNIFDTLQDYITCRGTCLAVLTLYKTKSEGHFSEEDLFLMNILSHHLNRLFYRALVLDNASFKNVGRAENLANRFSLTPREGEILMKLFSGDEDSAIARALSITPATLKKHLQHIYRKLGITSRWELLKF